MDTSHIEVAAARRNTDRRKGGARTYHVGTARFRALDPVAALLSRTLTVALLTAVYAVSVMDRQILSVLFEPLRHEFRLSDTQLGLLSGPAFVLFYSTLGIPLALWADRGHRARVITLSLAVFSAMTVACGLAAAYWQLLVARVGVAIGEAGTSPASQSIIAELYPASERTAAMGWFALGPHLGLLLGLLLGAWMGEWFGWRAAFWVAGAAGLVLAVITRKYLEDPTRSARMASAGRAPATLREALRGIVGSRALCHVFAGGSLLCFVAYGLVTWLPSLLVRAHGYVSDRLERRWR